MHWLFYTALVLSKFKVHAVRARSRMRSLLARVCKMDAGGELHQLMSLEDCSFCFILKNFEHFPVECVALLPTKMRTKLLLHLPVADVCKLERTAAVEGIDMTHFWKQAVLDICKPKEEWISRLKCHYHVEYGNKRIAPDQFWEEIVKLNSKFVAACPSTKQEIHRGQGQGLKQFYSEMVYEDIVFKHYGPHWEIVRFRREQSHPHKLLCTLRCCCGPSHPLVSQPSESTCPHLYGVVPPRYSTVASSEEELVQLALSCFGPPTRLRLWTCGIEFSHHDLKYLTDQSVVGNLEELSIVFWKDSVQSHKLNQLFSSTNRLASLHIEFDDHIDTDCSVLEGMAMLCIPSTVREVHIHNPAHRSLEPLLPLFSFLAHQPDFKMTISGGDASPQSVAELIKHTLNPTPLDFKYTTGSWSYTSDRHSIILQDVRVPESLLNNAENCR